ncbi:ATP-binding cassette domain-containing protein [Enterococcus sp. AZ007]|uniref:ATP-binding cassette domain-containing protein n=1 Tax=Enterococcus sp. AZ007 TaxID=2774839 RepID=UPI003F248F9E
MTQVLVKTTNLTKKYQKHTAVENVSMTIRQGDIYGFIGRNGAGKTTFIRLLTGLIQPTSGKIELPMNCKIGAVIEGPACYPHLSAYDNLYYYAKQSGMEKKVNIQEVLEFIGLENTGGKNTVIFH